MKLIMIDIIFEYIGELLFQYIGQSIRWVFFLGKKNFNDLSDSHYNYILSIFFYLMLGSLLIN